jgi:hypothetical protein
MDSKLLSFYIPCVGVKFTKIQVKNNLENGFLDCNIVRIDFVSILNPDKTVNPDYRSAFIHMYLRNNPTSIQLYKTAYVEENAFRFYFNSQTKSYWLLLKNKFPVPETDLNLSQVVENARLLEERVAKLEEINEYQATKLENIETVVYQLLGGLFNHRTQENVLKHNLNLLEDNNEVCWSPTNGATKSKWTHYPTTRQGDDSEIRIQALEKELKQVKRLVVFHDEYKCSDEDSSDEEDGNTNSTHSSMPGLEQIHSIEEDNDILSIDDDSTSTSTGSPMPGLISIGENDNNSIVSSSTHSSMPSLEYVNVNDIA